MDNILKEIDVLKSEFLQVLDAVSSLEELNGVRVEFLGKKGRVTALLKGLGKAAPEDRPAIGGALNELKDMCEQLITKRAGDIQEAAQDLAQREDYIDVTLPSCGRPYGKAHPVVQTMKEITDIFISLGFSLAEGPEIESDYYNFEALNFQAHHPARDMQDTFFVDFPGQMLLRTHTSPVQVRTMQAKGAPLRIICPGRVYRRDSDPTHSPMFHQVEGLLIDKDVSIADLKGCLQVFIDGIFGRALRSRWRASYFPFTEPSLEMDVECVVCTPDTVSECRVCKGTGWLEILGSGMVHPNVLRAGGIDPNIYNGFAFGMGVDRVSMLKYGLKDLRPLFEADLAYLGGA